MKARVRATGEIVEVEKNLDAIWHDVNTKGVFEKCYYTKDLDFDLDPPHPEATISGWVARDQPRSFSERGRLRLFHHMPHRDYCGNRLVICGFWNEAIFPAWRLDENLFPSLTWEDEPIEVEITIKPKKQ